MPQVVPALSGQPFPPQQPLLYAALVASRPRVAGVHFQYVRVVRKIWRLYKRVPKLRVRPPAGKVLMHRPQRLVVGRPRLVFAPLLLAALPQAHVGDAPLLLLWAVPPRLFWHL